MTPSRSRTSTKPSLGQLMALVVIAAALCSLTATIKRLEGRPSSLFLLTGCVVSYLAYLAFLALIAYPYFTRTEFLLLLGVTATLTAFLIQAVADASGEPVLAAVLVLPVLPLALGGWMLRRRAALDPEEDFAGKSETLATLVRNKRNRGLMPQAGPAPSTEEAPARGRIRWTRRRLAILAVAAMAVGAGGLILASLPGRSSPRRRRRRRAPINAGDGSARPRRVGPYPRARGR